VQKLLVPLLGFALLAPLAGCEERQDEQPAVQPTQPAVEPAPEAPKTPVKGVVLKGQGFDRDGDGKVETWYQRSPEGKTIEAKDTDGDGVADRFTEVEVDPNPPPGMEIGPDAMQELAPPKHDERQAPDKQ